jgi:hypothetical protein
MINDNLYKIGTPGKPWGDAEKQTWLAEQQIKRSYSNDVIDRLETLKKDFTVEQYGELIYDTHRYSLFAVRTKKWAHDKPAVLITGGVHGYETSGVHGALRFLETRAASYSDTFNFVVVPCISPWGYETINRWNPLAIDPNRSFKPDSPALEAALVMQYIANLNVQFMAHFDLHETTDTDNSEFRPALGARDGKEQDCWNIPDGFYLVGDCNNAAPDFQKAIISAVGDVTHIAQADAEGRIIGEPIAQEGVINYAVKDLGLCAGFTGAPYSTTTEVYPDSVKVTDEQCILAQVAAVCGGLDYLWRLRHSL